MPANVLIVDDSFVARLSLKSILRERDLVLAEANSGEAALERISSGAMPDLVFLDLTMPGKGGLETLRELASSHPSLPVVVVTADIQARTVEQAKQLGAAAVVRKPADKGQVLSAADRLLGLGSS